MRSTLVLGALAAGALLALLAPATNAQACAGTTFWKNDVLPDNPLGLTTFSVIPGLCEGEAAATYFQMPGGMAPQKLRQVSVGFGAQGGAAGFQATTNVEIYEGAVTFNANGTAVLGTKIFDLNADTGQSAQLTSTTINTFDMTPFNVVVSDDFVVAWRMNINVSFPGCPPAGAQANFITDNTSPGSGACVAGVNLLDELTNGWVDPATWGPLPPFIVLCPSAYAGAWVIRACTEDAASPWEDLGGGTSGVNGVPNLAGTGSLVPGQTFGLELTSGPPSEFILLWVSLTSSPIGAFGGTIHAFPFTDQFLLGTDPAGSFSASTTLPPAAPGSEVWFQFLCQDLTVLFDITLSNAVKGTTQ